MFKSWSIRSLLQLWSMITILSIVVIASVAIYTNEQFSDTQKDVTEHILPLENTSRQISGVLASLLIRQNQVITVNDQQKIDLLIPRKQLELQFEQAWHEIDYSVASNESGKAIVSELKQLYQQFLQIDSQLSELVLQKYNKASLVQAEIASAEKIEVRIRNNVEAITGKIAFEFAKKNHTNEPIQGYLNNSSSGIDDLYNVQQLSQALKIDTLTVVNQTQHLIQADNIDVLRSLKDNNFKQYQALLKSDIEQLKRLFVENSEFLPITNEIQQDLDKLIDILVNNDSSIYQLRLKQLLAEEQLAVKQQQSMTLVQKLMAKLVELSDLVSEQSALVVSDSARLADNAKWFITILSFSIALLMVRFVLSISGRITDPLNQLRSAMHKLTSQRFDTRLAVESGESEFSLLAADFNTFAANNQSLINDLASAKTSLEHREQHISAILNGVPEAILTLSSDGIIESSNPEAEKVLKADENTLKGLTLTRFFDEVEDIQHLVDVANLLETGQEFSGRDYNDQPFSMWLSLNPLSTINDDLWVCVIADITARKKAEQELRKASTELDTILENAMVGIAFLRNRRIMRVNHKFEELFSCDRDEIEGQSIQCVYPSAEAFEQVGHQAYEMLKQGDNYEGEAQLVRGDGEKFWCSMSSKAIDPNNPLEGAIWLYEDVTHQREIDDKLRQLASLDVLTGLPNRGVFNDRLDHAVHKATRKGSRLAVFFLDLDHFKHINDSLGHKAGDMLLCQVAQRLKDCVREGDTVARLGGDEFTLILEDIRSAQYVAKVAEKISESIAKTYSLDGTEVNVSTSVGISLFPADGREVEALIKNADAAMYHAKKNGRNNFQFYSAEMNAQAAERLAMETSLRRAVELNEFYLHFQPQLDLPSGNISGSEALLRWKSSQWGDVSPAIFVPILEDIGLIGEVGEFVLRQACEVYISLSAQLPDDFKMAVNLSGRQFHGGQLASFVKQTLEETKMSPSNLELEITESILMDDAELAITTLNELSQSGVTLSIDDFGTGYSSLSYLKRFPLDVLKIDRSFVRDVIEDADDAAIVDAILAMSRRLQLDVVAEGVETAEQLAFLQAHDCSRVQGYFYSRPLEFEQFSEFVTERTINASL